MYVGMYVLAVKSPVMCMHTCIQVYVCLIIGLYFSYWTGIMRRHSLGLTTLLCVFVCVCTYVCAGNLCVFACVFTCISVCVCACVLMCVYVCIYVYLRVRIYTCIHTCVWMCECCTHAQTYNMWVCACVRAGKYLLLRIVQRNRWVMWRALPEHHARLIPTPQPLQNL